MKVSVIMAVYNEENYLKIAIESILNQTYKDFEFIIIDDASTDNSLEIISVFAKQDKRIRIIQNNVNEGLTKSLNKAIRVAQGDIIARFDVDDISLPKRLEKQVNFLQNNSNVAFCGTNVIVKQNIKDTRMKSFKLKDIRKNLIQNNCFVHSTICIRKKIFKIFGFYNEKYLYGQDYELWCRLIYKFRLKATILEDKLVIMNIPIKGLMNRNKKIIIQHKNYIKTRLIYLKNVRSFPSLLKGIIYIVKNVIEVFVIFYSILIKFQFSELR